MKLLLKWKADLNATDGNDGTALVYAMNHEKTDVVDVLKKAGAILNLYGAASVGD